MDDKSCVIFNSNIENVLQKLTELYFNNKHNNICYILKLQQQLNHTHANYKYNKENEGMIFSVDENPLIDTRIVVDEETRYILNTLLMITSNLVNEGDVTNLMIEKWLKNHTIGLIDKKDIPKTIGDEYRIHLKVSKKCWDKLTKSCKNKNILVKDGFKMTLLDYLEEIYIDNINYTQNIL